MVLIYVFKEIFVQQLTTTLITLLIGFVVYKLVSFYMQLRSLPPGPFPLPLIGNLLLFQSEDHWNTVITKCNQKYGPVFTFWMGSSPLVYITDIEIARKVFYKKDFTGRLDYHFKPIFSNNKYQDIGFSDPGKTWFAMRKVVHNILIKSSTNDKLINLVNQSVDKTVELMINTEGINKEFNANDYIYLIFMNIITTSALGKSYSMEDQDYKRFKFLFKDFPESVGPRLALWEFSKLMRLYDCIKVKKQVNLFKDYISYLSQVVKSHYKDYDLSVERDFCDALITAKNDALKDEELGRFNDDSIAITLLDFMIGSTDTSQLTFRWMLLLLAYYPEIQQKLRQEIECKIGNRSAKHEDRPHCHYVMAFISESLRFRNITPSGLPHKAMVSSKIGNYSIPKGNGVIVYHGLILMDETHWPNADEFRPERFLSNGKNITTTPKAYIPFGIGRRACLGDKLAIADLFLVLVRILQMTSNYDIVLGANSGIGVGQIFFDFVVPFDYKIILRNK